MKRINRILISVLTITLMESSMVAQEQLPKPPVAKRMPKSTQIHGQTVVDEYFWLRDKSNPAVTAYLKAENDYADFPPLVMTFAASDPSGGSGMQADVLTLASMGCHPLTIVTALTVQDTLGVEGVFPVDSDLISDQARCVLEDMPVDAFKIGLFGSVENISAIAEIVADYPDVPLVLDPMLSNGRGDELTNDEMIAAIISSLVSSSP